MKHCPKCNADYFDNMLEFCLEDGTRLADTVETKVSPARPTDPMSRLSTHGPLAPNASSEETVVIPSQQDKTAVQAANSSAQSSWAAKALETAPIVIALAHNWWQWLYLEKQYVSSITDYVLSANFLMWLLLLAVGGTISFLAVKHSRNKTLGIVSLVVLAINLILFLVPRR